MKSRVTVKRLSNSDHGCKATLHWGNGATNGYYGATLEEALERLEDHYDIKGIEIEYPVTELVNIQEHSWATGIVDTDAVNTLLQQEERPSFRPSIGEVAVTALVVVGMLSMVIGLQWTGR